MRISCIVAAYNVEPYLGRAVESLLATRWPDLEIVVVDDGSSDRTRAVAEAMAASHRADIVCVSHPDGRNHGVSATRNLGIARATGDLLCFLDGDDFVYPRRFEMAAQVLAERRDVDGVYGSAEIQFEDAESEARWWDSCRTFGLPGNIRPGDLLDALLTGRSWHTSSIVVRRRLLSSTGVFEPELRIAEDCHLWFRLACAGTLVGTDPAEPVSVYWRRQNSAYEPTDRQRRHMIRAMILFFRWMEERDPMDPRLPGVARSISEYILGSMNAARTARDRRLAWIVAAGAAAQFPAVLAYRRYYGQLWRMALGR